MGYKFCNETCTKISGEDLYCGSLDVEDVQDWMVYATELQNYLDSGLFRVDPSVINGKGFRSRRMTGGTWYSPANGMHGKFECGLVPSSDISFEEREWFFDTTPLGISYSWCPAELLGTEWEDYVRAENYQSLTKEGKSRALTNHILEKTRRKSANDLSQLMMWGDYGSGVSHLSHMDGLIKQIYHAYGENANKVERFTFSQNISTGDFINVIIGGKNIVIPFTGSMANTMQLVVDEIAAITHPCHGEVYTVTYRVTDREITVYHNIIGLDSHVGMWATGVDGVDISCPSNNATSGLMVTVETLQDTTRGNAPTMLPYEVVRKDNVEGWLCNLQEAVQAKVDFYSGTEYSLSPNDFTFHVSTSIAAAIKMANAAVRRDVAGDTGVQDVFASKNERFTAHNGLKFYVNPFLKDYMFFGSVDNNAIIGTDRLDAVGNPNSTREIRVIPCPDGNIKIEHKFLLGLMILRPELIISNIPCTPNLQFSDRVKLHELNEPNRACVQVCEKWGSASLTAGTDAEYQPLSFNATANDLGALWQLVISDATLATGAEWEIQGSTGGEIFSTAANPTFALSKTDITYILTYKEVGTDNQKSVIVKTSPTDVTVNGVSVL